MKLFFSNFLKPVVKIQTGFDFLKAVSKPTMLKFSVYNPLGVRKYNS